MKILYLSHHREKSGWGRSCRDLLKSLISTGVDVVSRPVIVNNRFMEVDPEIEETDRKDTKDCTHVIQYVLPFHMSYSGNFEKNIGITLLETSNIQYTKFPCYINLLDEFWYLNSFYEKSITIPNKKILQPIDLSVYNKEYRGITFKKYNENYKFYTVCELSKRKNISNLIRTYYSTFNYNDNVTLVLKLTHPIMSPQQIRQYITNHCIEIAEKCKKYKKFEDYPKIEIISEYLTEEQIYGLHQSCDCYISCSYGEGINYPMLDAAGFKRKIISSTYFDVYNQIVNAEKIPNVKEFVFDQMETFGDYNSCNEVWNSFNQVSMSKIMRNCYEKNISTSENNINKLSYEENGKKMIGEILC